MSDSVTNYTSLTDELIEIFKYYTDKSKTYTKNEIKNQIKKYSKDLQLTKDQLNELIKSLDNLDFIKDGKVSVDALVAKIAKIEAIVNTNINDIKTLNDNIKQQNLIINDLKEKIKDLDEKIISIENIIKNIEQETLEQKTISRRFF